MFLVPTFVEFGSEFYIIKNMAKTEELKKLEEKMAADSGLPLAGFANLVFGEGNPDCKVLFIGEAPGFHEDQQRRPFVGRGGQLLRREIHEAGFQESQVYITNIVKRRPPENRDPLPEEIEAYKPYLAEQIRIIAPKVIVPLGRFSMNYFLPEAKITRDQGKVFRLNDMLIMPMFHPAAALRSTEVLSQFKAGFKKLFGVVSGERLVEAATIQAQEAIKTLKEADQGKMF